jgi:hypothetical protein
MGPSQVTANARPDRQFHPCTTSTRTCTTNTSSSRAHTRTSSLHHCRTSSTSHAAVHSGHQQYVIVGSSTVVLL